MVGTTAFAVVAVSLLFFAGLTAALVVVFRSLERDTYQTTGRRKLARSTFGFGAVLSLMGFVGLATSFVLDVETVLGFDSLYVGVGSVVVAALPLCVGIVLGIDSE